MISSQSLNISSKFKFLSFKHRSERCDDILPGQLLCLRLNNSSSIETLFSKKGVSVLISGDILIVELSTESSNSYYLGILLSSGMFFLYDYDRGDSNILHFRIGINVRGATVSLSDKLIIIKSNIEIVLKVKEAINTDSWFQKLCQACTAIEVVNKPNHIRARASVKLPLGTFSKSLKSHFEFIKKSWKLHGSMLEISNNSWNFEESFLSPLTNPRNSNLMTPIVSDNHFIIDNNFKINSTVLARVCSSKNGGYSSGPFVESSACLTQYFLTLTTKDRNVKVAMKSCNLETISNLKWGIKIKSPAYIIDFELASKVAYEKWTLAFMKIFSFHCNTSHKSQSIGSNDSDTSIARTISLSDVTKYIHCGLHRCLSWNQLESSDMKFEDERITKSCPILIDISTNIHEMTQCARPHESIDNVFTTGSCDLSQRTPPKRNSSCLDFPIPIVPDFSRSKSSAHSPDSSCFETDSVYDEMESVCCDFERHFKNDSSSTPLPIRCTKHGIAKRIKISCKKLTRKLTKSSDLQKLNLSSKSSFLSAMSNKFQSEDNLRIAHKSNKSNKYPRLRGRDQMPLSNISRSVFDIRGPKCFFYGRGSCVQEILEDDHEDELDSDYEEPSSKSHS